MDRDYSYEQIVVQGSRSAPSYSSFQDIRAQILRATQIRQSTVPVMDRVLGRSESAYEARLEDGSDATLIRVTFWHNMAKYDDLVKNTAMIVRPRQAEIIHLDLKNKRYSIEKTPPIGTGLGATHYSPGITAVRYTQKRTNEGNAVLAGKSVRKFRIVSSVDYESNAYPVTAIETSSTVFILPMKQNIPPSVTPRESLPSWHNFFRPVPGKNVKIASDDIGPPIAKGLRLYQATELTVRQRQQRRRSVITMMRAEVRQVDSSAAALFEIPTSFHREEPQ